MLRCQLINKNEKKVRQSYFDHSGDLSFTHFVKMWTASKKVGPDRNSDVRTLALLCSALVVCCATVVMPRVLSFENLTRQWWCDEEKGESTLIDSFTQNILLDV